MSLNFELKENVKNCKYGVIILDFGARTLLTLYYDNPVLLEKLATPGIAFWQIPPNRDIIWMRQFHLIEEYPDITTEYAGIFSGFLRRNDKEKAYEEIRDMIRNGEEEEYDSLFCGTYQWIFYDKLKMMKRIVRKNKKVDTEKFDANFDDIDESKLLSPKIISEQMMEDDFQSSTIDEQGKNGDGEDDEG